MSETFIKLSNRILTPNKKKLKPIISHKKFKINKTLSSTALNSNNGIKQRNMSKDELSVLLFQSNEVDFVRSLNPDLDRDICSNLLLKGQLKNNINFNSKNNYAIRPKNPNNSISLPKLKRISINAILESERKLNQNKIVNRKLSNCK